MCPGARTRLSTGVEYEKHIGDLYRRGLLDEVTMRASLDSAPPAFAAPVCAYLASDLARDVTGQMLVAAGGFVGSFDRPTLRLLGYRDHHGAGPWSIEDVHKMIGAATAQR
jgi:3-oxoacyl-[acyl-carrier protein] reductase